MFFAFFVLLNASKTDTKLTLHHMGISFIIKLPKIKSKIRRVTFLQVFLKQLKILEWTSGFREINDLPRAHWDETEFSSYCRYSTSICMIISVVCQYFLQHNTMSCMNWISVCHSINQLVKIVKFWMKEWWNIWCTDHLWSEKRRCLR